MNWPESEVLLYHGTDVVSAETILNDGILLKFCAAFTDFGLGFYTTTNQVQALKWSKQKQMRTRREAAVLEMKVERAWLGSLRSLVFTRAANETGWAEFVRKNRTTPFSPPHDYDVVYGPVARWNSTCSDPSVPVLPILDYDQISFHTESAFAFNGPLLGRATLARSIL